MESEQDKSFNEAVRANWQSSVLVLYDPAHQTILYYFPTYWMEHDLATGTQHYLKTTALQVCQ